MKKAVIFLALVCLALSAGILTGCDDDDNPVGDGVATFMVGRVTPRPYIDFSVSLYEAYPQDRKVTSVHFADSLCIIGAYPHHSVHGIDFYYIAVYSNIKDSLRFGSGDIADITLGGPGGDLTVPIKMLRCPDDSIRIIGPEEGSTVNQEQDFEIVWHEVANADWYGLEIYFWYDSLGHHVSTSYYASSTDSTATIRAQNREGNFVIFVIAVTGPVPGTGQMALDADGVRGSIYCCTRTTRLTVNSRFGPDKIGVNSFVPDSLPPNISKPDFINYFGI